MNDSALALDLGGTRIRAALVHRDGTISHLINRPTLASEGPDAVIERIVAILKEIVARAKPDPEIAIGIAAPGPLDPEKGILYFGPNLPGWRDVPLRDIISRRLGRPAWIGNDANCAALGEVVFGSGQTTAHLIYIGLGTGVGGGVISHGTLIEGAHGMGGELGHIPVDPTGPRCHCGGIGCLEAFAGGWAIARDGSLLVHSGRSTLIRADADSGALTAEDVAEAATAGDDGARAIFERAGLALAVGLGGLVNVFNPEVIIIGGGLSKAGDLFLAPLREALPRYAMRQIASSVQIRLSSLGSHTGIYGAAARVFYARPSLSDH